jgi:cytochrome c2
MRRWIPLILLWLASLAGALLAGAYAHKYRATIRSRLSSLQSSPVITTNLYTLRVQKLAVPSEGRDGAIDQLGDGILLFGRKGNGWFVSKDRVVQPLALRVPINVTEFETDPYNTTTSDQDRFSVKDILIQPLPSGVRLLASHFYWHKDKQCNSLRVSALETTREAIVSGQTGPGAWKTLFESSCRALNSNPDGRGHHVTLGGAGRLAALSDRQVLLTEGDFTGEYSDTAAATRSDDYGKTVLIDIGTGKATLFTQGHRNPQGLAVGPDQRIWLTEHGNRGGDELNLLVQGNHYGSPHVTYGTEYEMMVWPKSKTQGKHEGYVRPVFSWVPSIAPSQLVVLEGKSFPWWSGDLLVSSLESRTLYRVRVEEGRTIFVEPIPVGHRVRDIVEMSDGTLALKTDDNFLVYIDNVETAPAASLDPVTRGGIVAGQCRSCHAMQAGAPSGIGPNLFGILGRRVGSLPGYAYSDAMKRVDGSWSADRLRTFIADPGAFAPGNRMGIVTRYDAQQLNDLIAYLETLR